MTKTGSHRRQQRLSQTGQGEGRVAVKRQWCSELSKVANCQVGVFLGYASQYRWALLNRRLYLPQEWVEADDYAERQRNAVCRRK